MKMLLHLFLTMSFLLCALPGRLGVAQIQSIPSSISTDESRNAWLFRRSVRLAEEPKDAQALVAIELSPEVMAHAQPDGRDLRLIGFSREGHEPPREIPYLFQPVNRKETVRFRGVFIDRVVIPQKTVYRFDLGAVRSFDTVELHVPEKDFAKRVSIEVGENAEGPFQLLEEHAGIFEKVGISTKAIKLRQTKIFLPVTSKAQFLRITAADSDSPPLNINGVEVSQQYLSPTGSSWYRELLLPPPKRTSDTKETVYELTLEHPLPIEQISLKTSTRNFWRSVRLFEVQTTEKKGKQKLVLVGQGILYDMDANHLPNQTIVEGPLAEAAQKPTEPVIVYNNFFRLTHVPQGTKLVLKIENADNPPLQDLHLMVAGDSPKMVFPVPLGQREWVLYYGNPNTKAPSYSLSLLAQRLEQENPSLGVIQGPEEKNPKFQKESSILPFEPQEKELDVSLFEMMQPIAIPPKDDLYRFILPPEDLAWLRSDYSNLQIVNQRNQPVPFFVDAGMDESVVDFQVTPLFVKDNSLISRYRLQVLLYGKSFSLPIESLEIEVGTPFFSRTIRVLKPGLSDKDDSGMLLTMGQMQHQGPESSSHRIMLPRFIEKYDEMILEVDNQGQAPLSIKKIQGKVRVPRIYTKLKAQGTYRLLFGGSQAGGTQAVQTTFEVKQLEKEVISYGADPLELGLLQVNPAYRNDDMREKFSFLNKKWGFFLIGGASLIFIFVLIGWVIRRGKAQREEIDL